MKRIFPIILMITITLTASSQKLRLNVYGAKAFDETFVYKQNGYVYYKGRVGEGLQWGAGVEYLLDKEIGMELMYLHQATNMQTIYHVGAMNPPKNINYTLGLNYLLIGWDAHMQCARGKLEGYGGLFAGVAVLDITNPENGTNSTPAKFAWSARLGCNIWVTNRIGIKLQSQLLSSIQSAGKEFYLGAIAVSTYSSIFQLNMGGGLTYKLGH